MAVSLAVFAAVTDEPEPTPVAADAAGEEAGEGETSDCAVTEGAEEFPFGGGHAAKNFYEPTEATPLEDFGHSLGDGYVVVLYPETLEEPELDELRTLVTGPDGQGLLAGPSPEGGEEVKAVTAYDTMTCSSLDVPALQQFTEDWFESIQ